MADYKTVKNCRVCRSRNLRKYLDLGEQPLANSIQSSATSKIRKYPLQVLFCEDCGLSQLSVVLKPDILYRNYPYHSSVSETFRQHCRDMARRVRGMVSADTKPFILDIASNDGCLLNEFKEEGFNVLGVEPCWELVKQSRKKGIATCPGFWSSTISMGVGIKFNVITATNVVAHVHDLADFLKGVNIHLSDTGIFILEVPHLYRLIENLQFDTMYHEHLSYFLIRPLRFALRNAGLKIFRVEEYVIHGGSIRVYASKAYREEESSVSDLEKKEILMGMYEMKTYSRFAARVRVLRTKLRNTFRKLRKKKVMGYGASAKGTTLLNYCGITNTDISAIVDDTPEKQGKFLPGSGIPVVPREALDSNLPDYIALMSWNFSEELMQKTVSHHERGCKYIIPVPKVSIL